MSSEKFSPYRHCALMGQQRSKKKSVMLHPMQEAYAPVPPDPKRKENSHFFQIVLILASKKNNKINQL